MKSLVVNILLLGLLANCGSVEDEDRYTREDAERDYEARKNKERVEELEGEKLAQKRSEEPTDPMLWTFNQLTREIRDCEDHYWHESRRNFEDVERFCRCRTEMISVRWGWDDYKLHPFSYADHLERTGRLDRCTEPSKFSLPDEEKAIVEDSEWTPEENSE